jgi:hypothetical protein
MVEKKGFAILRRQKNSLFEACGCSDSNIVATKTRRTCTRRPVIVNALSIAFPTLNRSALQLARWTGGRYARERSPSAWLWWTSRNASRCVSCQPSPPAAATR